MTEAEIRLFYSALIEAKEGADSYAIYCTETSPHDSYALECAAEFRLLSQELNKAAKAIGTEIRGRIAGNPNNEL